MIVECTDEGLAAALEQIAAGGDRSEALVALAAVGALGLTRHSAPMWRQLSAVRGVARADAVVGRIYERHLEAVERLAALAPEPLRSDELDAVAAGELVLGVWEHDPAPGHGDPVRLRGGSLAGVKVHCPGAGLIDRVIVRVRGRDGAGVEAYLEAADGVVLEPPARPDSLPESAGPRVRFEDVPVLATLAPAGSATEHLRSRTQLRAVARWAGLVDAAADAALDALAAHPARRAAAGTAGRVAAAQRTIDLWLHDAARRADADPTADQAGLAADLRATLAVTARSICADTYRTLGHSAPRLDAARIELDLLPGMHRPDPDLVASGRAVLRARERQT